VSQQVIYIGVWLAMRGGRVTASISVNPSYWHERETAQIASSLMTTAKE